MPWSAASAKQKKADMTDAEAKIWARVANDALARCLKDGKKSRGACETSAIRIAHSVINKRRAARSSYIRY